MSKFDQSHKDSKYFICNRVYNCPFCNRRNVSYRITDTGCFDSTNEKSVYFYIVTCGDEDCRKRSLHLSKYDIAIEHSGHTQRFVLPPQVDSSPGRNRAYVDILDEDNNVITELDNVFYHHEPSSFFTIDARVPISIRKPLSESYNSLKSNLITGASAGLRKAIYKLLQTQNIPEVNPEGGFYSHDQRVELLKEKHPSIEPDSFDELKAVHSLTSQELHENDWEDFNVSTLRFLIEITKEILNNLYIIPDEKNKRKQVIAKLKTKAKPRNVTKKE